MRPYIINPGEFKRKNLENWRSNTEFWLESPLRHVAIVANELREVIESEYGRRKGRLSVVDLGCGSAWVLDLLQSMDVDAHYTGLDFNPDLIERLKEKYKGKGSFRVVDLETKDLPVDLDGFADIVVASFSLFEIPDVEQALNNATRILKPTGALFVSHIDPVIQLLSVYDRRPDFRKALEDFEEHGHKLAYDKIIELTGARTDRTYKGILHRISDYHRTATELSLTLEIFREVVDPGDGSMQQYQIAVWRAPENTNNRLAVLKMLPYTLLLAPFALAGYLIITYAGDPDSIIGSFNRIAGNLYPVSSALLVMVIAGFATVLLSLFLYLRSTWAAMREVGHIAAARRSTALGFAILVLVAASVVFLLVLFCLGQADFLEAGPKISAYLEDLLWFSRWLNIWVFSAFLVVDCLVWWSLSKYANRFEIRSSAKRRKMVENDISFARVSVFVVDLPVLALAVLTVTILHVFEKNPSFHFVRDVKFPNHSVLAPLDPATYRLTLHGIEAGVIAASLLISQLLFLALLARWKSCQTPASMNPRTKAVEKHRFFRLRPAASPGNSMS